MRNSSLFVLTFAFLGIACGSAEDRVGWGGVTETYESTFTPGDTGGDDGDPGEPGDAVLHPVDETVMPLDLSALVASESLVTTGDLNLRKGPAKSFDILAVIPKGTTVKLLDPTPSEGFLNVEFNGIAGWASGNYLAASGSSPSPSPSPLDLDGAPSPANALARAKSSVGFSYWWGGGAWLPSGATSSNMGSCTGSCPSCSHQGSYGADCSGMVAKAWQFGPKDLTVNAHPYSTRDMVKDLTDKWATVSRDAVKAGDALVYNADGAGHVVIWEKGDAWGASTVIECRGCSYGCVYNTRSFGSQYKAIRRSGF